MPVSLTANTKSPCASTTAIASGASALSRATTAAVLAAFGIRNTSSSLFRYAMRSSTTPPSEVQHKVYCACPGRSFARSLVRQVFTYAAAPGPFTTAFPRWLTSNIPTPARTARCSVTAPVYSRGIDQPPNSANLAPSST